ncbi:hypothetical protein C7B76_06865 [filamentous cyanobacterium CCP2]|nr:hypothetical protein C7B76_06865 [filamentous cyanobacterium CCP2]
MHIKNTLRTIFVAFAIVPSLAFAGNATPLEVALENCEQRIEAELPGSTIEFTPGLELLNGLVLLRWQTDRGIAGFCRVTSDGSIVEFVNPYALPRGQRPIESLVFFETDEYTVRVLRLVEQIYLTVYDRTASKIELDRALAQVIETENGTIYTNLLGRVTYQAIVSPEGEYRLVIQSAGRTTYESEGSPSPLQETIRPSFPLNP